VLVCESPFLGCRVYETIRHREGVGRSGVPHERRDTAVTVAAGNVTPLHEPSSNNSVKRVPPIVKSIPPRALAAISNAQRPEVIRGSGTFVVK